MSILAEGWAQKSKAFIGARIQLACVSVLLFVIWAPSAEAIPVFARKYETSCTTCHTLIPKRNSFGEAFRRNGYRMTEGEEDLVRRIPVSMGAQAWKEQFPDSVWPSDIPADLPVSFYVDSHMIYDPTQQDNEWSFDAPFEFATLIGGTYGENISFFGSTRNNDFALWVQFTDIFGPENAFNIKFGRMEPAITWGYRENDRTTIQPVPIYDMDVTGSKWSMRDKQAGAEVSGILGRNFEYAAGFVNGDGQMRAGSTSKPLDSYFRIGAKFGGLGLDGSGANFDTLQLSNNWEDNSLSVGLWGYSGTNLMGSGSNRWESDFDRVGVDVKLLYNQFNFRLGWVDGTDDRPTAATGPEKDSDGWFLETDVMLKPWLSALGRYGETEIDGVKEEEISLALVGLVVANVRFSLEFLQQPSRETDETRWIKLGIFWCL